LNEMLAQVDSSLRKALDGDGQDTGWLLSEALLALSRAREEAARLQLTLAAPRKSRKTRTKSEIIDEVSDDDPGAGKSRRRRRRAPTGDPDEASESQTESESGSPGEASTSVPAYRAAGLDLPELSVEGSSEPQRGPETGVKEYQHGFYNRRLQQLAAEAEALRIKEEAARRQWLSLQRKLGAVLHSVTCKEEVIKERAGAAALVTMSIKKNTTRGSLATTGGDFEKVSALQNELTQLMSKQRKDLAEVDHLRKQARELAVSLQWHAEVTKLLTVKLRCLGKEVQRLTTMKDAGLQCFVQTAGRHPAVVAELASLQQEKFKIKEHNAHCRAQVSCAQDHVKILLQENDRLRRMIATKVDLAQLALGELANIPKRQRIMAISRGITVGKEEVPILVGSDEASTPSDEPELQIDTGWEAEACYVQLTLATGDAQTFGDPPPQASPTSVEPKQLQVSLPNTLRTELVPTPRPRRVVDHPLASPRSARRREQVVPSPVARTPRAPRVRLGVCLSPRVGMTTLPPLPQRGPR